MVGRLKALSASFVVFTAILALYPFALYVINVIFWLDAEAPEFVRESFKPFWFIYIAFFLVVHFVLSRRFKRFPLKPRSPRLLVIPSIASFIMASWCLYSVSFVKSYDKNFSCSYIRWIYNLSYPSMLIPYYLRAYRLHILFQSRSVGGVNQPLMMPGLEPANSELMLTPTEENTQATEVKLLKIFLFTLIPFLIMSIVDTFVNVGMLPIFGNDLHCENNQKISLVGARWFWIIFHYFEAVSLLFAARKTSDVWEEFSIKNELQAVAFVGVQIYLFSLSGLFSQWFSA